MSTQTHALHRSLLRPMVICTLRAVGFHSTRPSVLDTLVDLTERYLLLLATTTARQTHLNHNSPEPGITDVRMAMVECGALAPDQGPGLEEEWKELMRRPVEVMGKVAGSASADRMRAEQRKREAEDVEEVAKWTGWFESAAAAEVRRVAGLAQGGDAGVGGGVVQADDVLTALKRKWVKSGGSLAGDERRWAGTSLGTSLEEEIREEVAVVVEGGPVKRLREWRPEVDQDVIHVARGSQDAQVDGMG